MMKSATVDPKRLREALQSKLGAATWKVIDLQKFERPDLTSNESGADLVSHFLASAGSVYETAETFGKAELAPGNFRSWVTAW